MRLFQIVFTLAMVAICTDNALSQEQKATSCITSSCHPTFGKAKFVHGPIAVGECLSCHELASSSNHKFKPITNSGATCTKCHEPMVMKSSVHAPVKNGQCTSCHDPHQSDKRYLIKKASISEVCLTCHKPEAFTKKSKHGPVAEGDCLACHTPHTGEKPKLLLQNGNELCFQCHVDIKESMASSKHTHKPAAENCISCHNPHSDNAKFLLAAEAPEQCYTCHTVLKDTINAASVKHVAMDQQRKCMNCHSPHTAAYSHQLTDEPLKLCLACHDKAVQTPYGVTIASIKELLEGQKNWHGPIRERDCSGCHAVHGSSNFKILVKPYPKEFYTSFSQEQYDLCFSCHQPSLVQDAKTSTLTGFRDGDVNLHYLHVNKKVKGRTCRACHETHASSKPRHIRENVPFGSWKLPIRFESVKDGGKCTPGCHAAKEYLRSPGKSRTEK